MQRSFPWWLQAFLIVGAVEAIAIGATGWLSPEGPIFHRLLPIAVTPLNGRVIGGFYLAGAVGLIASYLTRRAIDARIFIFGFGFIAGSLFIATLVYWEEFSAKHVPIGWLATYAIDPILAVIAIVGLGLLRPARSGRHRLSTVYLAVALLLGVSGFVLLLAPGTAIDLWPWKLTTPLARVYACMFIGFGLGAALAAREARPAAIRPFAIAIASLPIFVLIGSVQHLDRFKHGVHEWLWFGIVGVLAIALTGTLPLVFREAESSDADAITGAAVASPHTPG
jgi:hypothetical protein